MGNYVNYPFTQLHLSHRNLRIRRELIPVKILHNKANHIFSGGGVQIHPGERLIREGECARFLRFAANHVAAVV